MHRIEYRTMCIQRWMTSYNVHDAEGPTGMEHMYTGWKYRGRQRNSQADATDPAAEDQRTALYKPDGH